MCAREENVKFKGVGFTRPQLKRRISHVENAMHISRNNNTCQCFVALIYGTALLMFDISSLISAVQRISVALF